MTEGGQRHALRARRDDVKIGRLILIEIVVLIIVAALGLGGYYLWWQGQNYVSTDDAQLQSNLVTIVATAPGKITNGIPTIGEKVTVGDQLFSEEVSAPATSKTSAATAPTTISMPVDATATGSVAQVSVVDGQVVGAGTPLATVVATNGNRLVANIPETQIDKVKVGQTVDVTIDAYPGDSFPGHVESIVPATQSALSIMPSTQSSGNYTKVTQRIPVVISFKNPSGDKLYTGLSVEVRIHVNGS